MRTDWIPASAAALAVGGSALFLAARTTPQPDGGGAVLRAVISKDNLWTSPAIILLVASVSLLLGLPSLLALLGDRGRWSGRAAVALMAVSTVIFAGLAQQLLFLHSLVQEADVPDGALVRVLQDGGHWRLVLVGFGLFYVAELLLAYALWCGGRTPRLVPAFFVAHVGLVAFDLVTQRIGEVSWGVVLLAAGFASCAICANLAGLPPRRSSEDVEALHAATVR